MSNEKAGKKILFVGGPWDGRRAERPGALTEECAVRIVAAGTNYQITHTYYAMHLAFGSEDCGFVYRHEDLLGPDAFRQLIAGYKKG